MRLFARLLESRNWWPKALPVGMAVLLLGNVAPAQYMDTFNVGSGDPAGNVQPLVDYTTSIYATNFLNDTGSTFSFNLSPYSQGWLNSLYQGWYYTGNFTNAGEMDCVTGFRFDTQHPSVPLHVEAGSFYNAGNINCGISTLNYFGAYYFNSYSYGYGYGGIDVWATNIFNSGTIAVGADGLARFTGDNIDVNRGTVMLSQDNLFGFGYASANLTARGQTDNSTNDWSAAGALQPTFAYGVMNTAPYQLYLYNSVPYFNIQPADNTGSNMLVQMVFLQDGSINVATNVYFSDGNSIVEWQGTYIDPATGQSSQHYLYLYDQGVKTNILKYGDPGVGVPGNYTFSSSTTPFALGAPAPSGYVNGVLSSDNVTNNLYSYVDANFIATSVSTNGTYGPIALTNLPGRIEFNAAKSLNFSLAGISGMNYIKLNSTNEFNTDGQSQYAAPYSDLYLGHTNGNMTVKNLVQSYIPQWSGSVQAWSTRFTNTVGGINFDYRVLLVASQLNPITDAQVQDLVLYSSNNVVIGDKLNITRKLSINCTNLLVITNGIGTGASSIQGELNLNSPSIYWATSFPRLRCLTNNGSISTLNASVFGSSTSPYLTMFNSGTIFNSGGTTINALDFENYGVIYAGSGSFTAQSSVATMTNGAVFCAGPFNLAANSATISQSTILAGKSLVLAATNLLTDNGVNSSNYWLLGQNYSGYGAWTGLVLPVKPTLGDLLGTTIQATAVTNGLTSGGTLLRSTWAGMDRGYSVAGFKNNEAIGKLILDSQGPASKTGFYFTGTGSNNAIYVDCLQLLNYAGYSNRVDTVLPALDFNTNLVIYYAQALTDDGVSIAKKINGFNDNHLRWVAEYAGHFSSTNMVYPDGTTNVVNAALVQDNGIDSDGDGILNYQDPTPVFVPSQVKFTATLTNQPPLSVKIQWKTIPLATNYVEFTTNLAMPDWQPFTNFANYYYGANIAVPNTAQGNYFVSPQPNNSPATNVWVFDAVTGVPHYYRVLVQPIYP